MNKISYYIRRIKEKIMLKNMLNGGNNGDKN